jgi:hypothetical protein
VSVADIDSLVHCKIRLQAIEEFRDYVVDQLAKIIKASGANSPGSTVEH